MPKNGNRRITTTYYSRFIILSAIILSIYGSIMIISAEMGESSADLSVISSTALRQFLYNIIAIFSLFLFMKIANPLLGLRKQLYWIAYFAMLALLVVTRAFTPVGGAYGWIRVGPISVQPSEFAKLFIIVFAAKMFGKNEGEINKDDYIKYAIALLIYVFVVWLIEKDFGSAAVIFAIGYICALIPPYKELRKIQSYMIMGILFVLVVFAFLLSDLGTKFLSNFSNHYQILRFLASANPFNYQYDSGYHLIMSLVSFATGGWLGLGYGKSIHKFMNFPNPSTDFILPVIVEEMGLVFGFIPILILYGMIIVPLSYHAIKSQYVRGKIIIVGTFMYFILHFILNIGGVSGLIPLTGVPLLLVSSGGSSLIACMSAIGFAESEINYYQKHKLENSK